MKEILFIIALLLPLLGQADLLDRIKLEDSIRDRVEQTLRVADPNSRAIVRFDFKRFKEALPGTNVSSFQDLMPTKIETADISGITITAYTELENFPPEISDSVYSVVPFEKSKIKLDIKKYPIAVKLSPRLNSKDLSDIADKSVKTFSQVMGLSLVALALLGMAFLFIQNNRKMNIFRDQIKTLATAISEGGMGGARSAPMPNMTESSRISTPVDSSPGAESHLVLHRLPIQSLAELMADCYWTEQDEYAHWIWKNLETSQQSDLYTHFEKMREYSMYFVNKVPVQMVFHDHPYYLQPNKLTKISQSDLLTEFKSDLGRWHLISPLRQEFLPMDLASKLKAVQMPTPSQNWVPQKTSEARKLKTLVRWGKITIQDEKDIFDNPKMIPENFKSNIPSLVWLAQKEPTAISQVLNQFDARSLAEAWVGPEEVLAKLEQSLPEKKLKLLQTYKTQTASSRSSPVYMALVQQGLKNEAA